MEITICAIILYVIGCILKKIKFIKDNLIPVILSVLGCLGMLVYQLIIGDVNLESVFDNGIISAALSVYVHQNTKQLVKMLPLNDKTKDVLNDLIDEHLKDKEAE